MAKRKGERKSDAAEQPDRVLGDDPLEGLDMEWLEREEGDLAIQVLGHDPFESMGTDWVDFGREDEPAPEWAVEAESIEREFVLPEISPVQTQPQPPSPAQPPAHIVTPTVPASRISATFHFPADFRWGVATAAHQVEGENIHNDWWAWEQEDGRIHEGHVSGLACNWWDNAEADFDRAAGMGLTGLRLSVEWSRVEPRPGVFDDSALARYGEMLRGLRERGIEPLVTLHHFSNPHWLVEQGGWEAPETIPLFVRFVRRVVESLGPYCDLWCTINEPNVYSFFGYLEGIFPPGKSDLGTALRVIRHMLAGHAEAYRAIHALQPHARVGLAHHMRVFDPVNPRSLLDRQAARNTDRIFNQAILTALTKGRWTLPLGFGLAWKLRSTLDWIGLNYYTRDRVAFDRSQPQMMFSRRQRTDGAELLDGGYGEFYPRGMFRSIQRLAHLGLPIYVTENGVPDDDDDQRPRYLLAHLHQMWHAIQMCYPVMGYYHWTLVDNFEWAEGWSLRFGLIELDADTQTRSPRPSADLYAEVIRENAITPRVIDTFAPHLRPKLLPG
ncbi:MAG TPA: glycoside hydrolase family 1 protein [Chloroflexi bacterium]|nr:glycoside hydrolase family 1 protein [Chloroflexota bacterium]